MERVQFTSPRALNGFFGRQVEISNYNELLAAGVLRGWSYSSAARRWLLHFEGFAFQLPARGPWDSFAAEVSP